VTTVGGCGSAMLLSKPRFAAICHLRSTGQKNMDLFFLSPVVVIRMMLLPCPINKRPLMGDGYSVVGWQANLVLCILGMSVP